MAGIKRKNEEPHTVRVNTPSSDVMSDPRTYKSRNMSERSTTDGGAFSASSIPAHNYSLGEDVFLTVGDFKHRTYIHIRRYKLFGDVYYPTKEGVSLTRNQFKALTESANEHARAFDDILSDGTQTQELRVQISPVIVPPTSKDPHQLDIFPFSDRKFLFTRSQQNGRATSITLDDSQWRQLFVHKASVIESVIALLFSESNLIWKYESAARRMVRPLFSQTRIHDSSLAHVRLRELFSTTLRNHVAKMDFLPHVYDYDYTIDAKVADFNLCLFSINSSAMIEDFHTSATNEPYNPNIEGRVEYHVTQDFFHTLNPLDLVLHLRNEMCLRTCK